MSCTRETTIWCDTAGCVTWIQTNERSARKARRCRDANGWTYSEANGDRCPSCACRVNSSRFTSQSHITITADSRAEPRGGSDMKIDIQSVADRLSRQCMAQLQCAPADCVWCASAAFVEAQAAEVEAIEAMLKRCHAWEITLEWSDLEGCWIVIGAEEPGSVNKGRSLGELALYVASLPAEPRGEA